MTKYPFDMTCTVCGKRFTYKSYHAMLERSEYDRIVATAICPKCKKIKEAANTKNNNMMSENQKIISYDNKEKTMTDKKSIAEEKLNREFLYSCEDFNVGVDGKLCQLGKEQPLTNIVYELALAYNRKEQELKEELQTSKDDHAYAVELEKDVDYYKQVLKEIEKLAKEYKTHCSMDVAIEILSDKVLNIINSTSNKES